MPARPNLTPAQQGKVLALITKNFIKASVYNERTVHFTKVAHRLRNWMAGVKYDANWQALYDHIERQYAWGRISLNEAVYQLRQIGVSAFPYDWKFPAKVEQERRLSMAWEKQKQAFDPVRWELDYNKKRVDDAA